MQRHVESPAHHGRFDPDWVRAHDRLIAQQRLRSGYEVETAAPWWRAAIAKITRTTRPDSEQ